MKKVNQKTYEAVGKIGKYTAIAGAVFGLLEAGYKADLTICDYNSPTPLLADNIAGHIAFGMGSGSVHSVMVNGVMVYEDRQFNFDCDSIYAQARKAAASMWRRMDALA